MKKKKNKRTDRKAALARRTESTSQNRSGAGDGGVLDISDYEDVNFYKPEKGDNVIDIVPFEVSEEWYPTLRSPRGKPINVQVGDLDYKLEIAVHRGIGAEEKTVICLLRSFGKPCPICEERKAADDPAVEKELKSTWRSIYNVKEPEGEDTIKIFDVSEYLFERELLEEATQGDDIVSFSDLEDGMSIKFRAKPEKYDGNAYFKFKKFDFVERDEELDESILEDVYSFDTMLTIPTYEQIAALFLGASQDEDDDDNSSDDEPTPRKKKAPKKKSTPDFLEDLDDNEIVDCPECDRPIPEDAEECPYDECDAEFEGGGQNGNSDNGDDSKDSKSDEIEFDADNPECPFDGNFGDDCMNIEQCDECPEEVFDACSNYKPKTKTKKTKKKEEDTPKKKKKRTRKK